MNRASCPSPEELQQLHAGTFPTTRIDAVTAHLDDCSDCQEFLAKCGSSWSPLVHNTFQFDQEAEYQDLERSLLGLSEVPSSDKIVALRDYQLLEKVGEGGMGVVYKARHTKMDRVVAIKLVSRKFLRDLQAIARFERETRTAGLLDHPHIVRAYDAGEVHQRHFLVLEYLDGKNMSEVVAERGPLSIANACEIIRQAALGVHYAHKKGLVHRDLKPSNVMLVRPNLDSHLPVPVVKILDYGLSQLVATPGDKITGTLTDTGQIMGTLEYMAPEQCKDSRDITPEADLYSLGATFYKLLTGQAPFSRDEYDSYGKLFHARITDTPKPVRTLRREIPHGLARLVDWLLSVAPESRPSAEELAKQLVPFTKGHDLSCLLVSPTDQKTAELSLEKTVINSLQTQSDPHTNVRTPRSKVRTIVGLLSILGLLALGIVLVIRTPDGKETRQTLPDGTQIAVITSPQPPRHPQLPPNTEPTRSTTPASPAIAESDPAKITTDDCPPAIAATADPDRAALVWMMTFNSSRIVADVITASKKKIRFEIINGSSDKTLPDERFWLNTIMFFGTSVEDADLWRLRELKRLTAVVFGETNVTAAGLPTLRELPIDNISWWPHRDEPVLRAEDIAAIVQFKRLQRLSLMGRGINAEILRPLATLPELWGLGLFNCELEPDAMEGLTGVTSLTEMNIYNSTFHDSFMPSLSKMPFLRTIHTTQSTERMLPLSRNIPECGINCKGTWLLAGKILPGAPKPR